MSSKLGTQFLFAFVVVVVVVFVGFFVCFFYSVGALYIRLLCWEL